jgi:DnaD/phage-associated family protein
MSDQSIKLTPQEADRLLACADGTAALLLLHVRRTGTLSLSAASRDLKCSAAEVRRACEVLRCLELLPPEEAPPETRELPEYNSADITARAREDGAFETVVLEAQRSLGRGLSGNDLRLLFGIYDHLGLPADVIMLLLNHCVEAYQARYGAGRRPTMRYVEKEAWHWAENEVLTLDDAEAHIRREKQRQETVGQMKEVLQIRGRSLTAGEKSYIDRWLAQGFAPEAVAIAYDRTVLSTGKLAWRYLDKILSSWAEKNLFTPEEIASGDPRRGAAQGRQDPPQPAQSSREEKLRRIREVYQHLNGEEK